MRILKILIVTAAIFTMFSWACRKSYTLDFDESQPSVSIKSAFNDIKYQDKLSSNINDTIKFYWEPNWSLTKEIKNGDTAFFYVPLTAKAVNTSSGKAIKIGARNIAKFLLLKRYDGQSNFYIESFVGYEQSVSDPVEFSSGLSDFSGNLTLYNLISNEEYVYEYSRGEFKPNNRFADKSLKSANILNTQLCSYIEVCSWTRSCLEGLTVTVTESPSSQIAYAFPCPPPTNVPGCSQEGWIKSHSYLKVYCSSGSQPPPPPIPPGPIGSGPGGGTGNEGESSQTPVPADTNVSKIALYCSNFPKSSREKFNTTFYNLLTDPQRGCFYNYIYTSFKNPNKPVRINICYGGTANANGSYDPVNKTLYYPNDFMVTVTNTLGHEFFHVFQDFFYPGGIAQYNTAPLRKGFSNIEFEQALFYDLISKGDIPSAMARGSVAQREEYRNWLANITSNWTTYPKNYSELAGRYFEFMEMFKNLYPEYSTTTDNDLLPLAMLSAFNGMPCPMP